MQFTHITSLNEFMNKYGSEEQCKAALIQERWPNGFTCPICGGARYCEIKSRNVYQCNTCHHQTTLYAGTIYEQTKLPLRKWFLADYLISRDPDGFSAINLSRILGVSYNTAWSVKRKLVQNGQESDQIEQDQVEQVDATEENLEVA